MLSSDQIVSMAQDQGKIARKAGYKPYILTSSEGR